MQELRDKEGHWKVWEGVGSVIVTHGSCIPTHHELPSMGIPNVCAAMCIPHVAVMSGVQPLANPP